MKKPILSLVVSILTSSICFASKGPRESNDKNERRSSYQVAYIYACIATSDASESKVKLNILSDDNESEYLLSFGASAFKINGDAYKVNSKSGYLSNRLEKRKSYGYFEGTLDWNSGRVKELFTKVDLQNIWKSNISGKMVIEYKNDEYETFQLKCERAE